MQAIILYATKSGATGECASLLAKKLECAAYDLTQAVPDIKEFDTVIIGTGVRMGKIYRPALSFIRNNIDLLLAKKTAIYFCNAYPDTFQKTIEKNIPSELVQKVVSLSSFGGRPPFTSAPLSSWLNTHNLELFLEKIIDRAK